MRIFIFSITKLCNLFLLLQLLLFTSAAYSQVTVRGRVIDASDNSPLAGVSVTEIGTGNAMLTDDQGTFTLAVKGGQSTLRFSFVGYQSKDVAIDGPANLTVSLAASKTELDEIVVVGYGTQKKVNLTGAVQTLQLDSVVNTPVSNSAQLMYGRFSGVQLTQGNGLPGTDGSTINIRGLGTFGNSVPLVVIDGMQFTGLAEFNRLAPADIETITVLKDASAGAIYGARGANGVIVITTKQGQASKFKVEYNNYVGFQRPTIMPTFLNAIAYAELMNEKYENEADGRPFNPRYTEGQLQQIRDGSNPDQFANTDWAAEIMQDAPIQNHYLSLSGGNENTLYRISLGYLDQGAIVIGKFRSKRYNFRANVQSDLKDWLSISNNLNGTLNKFVGPSGGSGVVNNMIYSFRRNPPTIPAYYSHGGYGFVDGAWRNVNPSLGTEFQPMQIGELGDFVSHDYNINDRLSMKATFKGFSFESAATLNLNFFDDSSFRPTTERRDYDGNLISANDLNSLSNSFNKHYRVMSENLLRYQAALSDHRLQILAGHSVIYDRNDNFNGSLQSFPSDNLHEFNAGGVANPTVAGGASEQSMQSFFGRVNYDYLERYLFEANIRRDGSSKFGPGNRYGTFPSFSAGWRISEEPFIKNMSSSVLSDLKLRGSWGRTGNNGIDNYIYDQTYNAGLDYVLGDGVVVGGVALTSLANPTILWETTEQYNIGLDLALLNNRLTLEADYFNRRSYDILYTNFPIPGTLGVNSLAAQNAAEMVNKGVELNLNYTERNGEFNYAVGLNMTRFAKNNVTSLGSGVQTIDGNTITRAGDPFQAYYGYVMEGIFQTAEEVAAAPIQFGSPRTAAGDIRYADLSGPAGEPDGIIDAFDRTVIGNPYPLWLFGLNANFNYKGIDLGILLQGIADVDRILIGNGQQPLNDERSNSLSHWTSRWTPENPSTSLPRMGGANNHVLSTFYVEDASYLRLKNIELGYTLPRTLLQKIQVSGIRLFISGQNMLTFTKMKNFDPERAAGNTNARSVPLYQVITGGLNVSF
ncbi:SusC/RagA family TonB-linked outer membrane protein [Parapedobacter sp. 2B3]|uniref:SusC/RagA family TonB-linked outer membrane protein n=1 Tax=Parapedobacter sp. 2B3 TaxID=3342381 RepID=UPI0035B5F040